MKIVCLAGSPRVGGNTDLMADTFLEIAKTRHAEIKKYHLNKLQFKGCQGCMGCKKTKETCVVQDDLTQVLEDVRNCDLLVLTSPVYYGDVTSQLKAFIDRTYCYLVPDFFTNPNPSRLQRGKKLVFLTTQGHPDTNFFSDIYPKYRDFLKWYGFEESHLVRGLGVIERGAIKTRTDILKEIQELAEKIVN